MRYLAKGNRASALEGLWCRFSNYEFADEPIGPTKWHICPAPSATLEWYDPWEQYHLSNTQEGVSRPYEALFALVDRWNIKEQRKPATLEWCAQYGLLGILPQTAYRIQKPARWLAAAEQRWFRAHEWEWIGGKWNLLLDNGAADPKATFAEYAELPHTNLGTNVQEGHSVYKTPHVYFRSTFYNFRSSVFSPDTWDYISSSHHPVPVSALVPIFFPRSSANLQYSQWVEHRSADSNPPVFDCPRPGNEMFWRIYSEPVEVFVSHARQFVTACKYLYRTDQHHSLRALERYLTPLSIALSERPDGKVVETWRSPSLLCTFARMALQDAMAGYTLRSCECCGTPFVRTNPRAQYCSQTCGFRHRKRLARSIASSLDGKKKHGKETRK